MSDPITILSTCIYLANDIRNFIEPTDYHLSEAIVLFRKAISLREPLRRLQSQADKTIETKEEALKHSFDTLSEVKMLMSSYMPSNDSPHDEVDQVKIKKLNIQLNDALIALQLGVTFTTDQADTMKQLNVIQGILLEQVKTLKELTSSSSLQTTHSNTSLENLYVNDPPMKNLYDNRSKLGSGSFGTVYRKKNILDTRLYAVKVLERTDADLNSISMRSIIREAEFLQELNHPNIVRYFASFYSEEDSLFNIVMELVDGGSLLLQITSPTPPPMTLMKKWLIQILNALQYMHDDMKVLHRDIKPQNILLTHNTQHIKIIDLGLATIAKSCAFSTYNVGTPGYASFEKANTLQYDGRDDIWGVGCIWSELLTRVPLSKRGYFNFEEKADFATRRKAAIAESIAVDRELGLVIEKMLDPIQSTRYTASQCLDMLLRKGLITPSISTQVSLPMSVVLADRPPTVLEAQDIRLIPFVTDRDDRIITQIVESTNSISLPEATQSVYKELIQCCKKRHTARLKTLLSTYNYDFLLSVVENVEDNLPCTLLQYICYYGLIEGLQILLNHPLIDVNVPNRFGSTPLILTASEGHVECVGKLLTQSYISINRKDQYGCTALIRATIKGLGDCVYCLLASPDIDVNSSDLHKHTAVMYACMYGHMSCLKALLSHPKIDLNLSNDDGETALTFVIESLRDDFMILLLETSLIDINYLNKDGCTELMNACEHGYDNAIRILIDYGADIHKLSSDGSTALLFASGLGDSSIVRLLLDKGADIDVQNYKGFTALMCASGEGNNHIVTLLLDRGADSTLYSINGHTAYHVASINNHVDTMKLIKERWICVDTLNNNQDYLDTHMSCRLNFLDIDTSGLIKWVSKGCDAETAYREIVQSCQEQDITKLHNLLTKNNSDLVINFKEDTMTNRPSTILQYICYYGLVNGLQIILLHNKIDVNLSNQVGETALMYACSQGHAECVEALLKHRDINLSLCNNRGQTALTVTIFCDQMKCMKLLLDSPYIDINQVNQKGNTALVTACYHGHENSVQMLLDHGADIHIHRDDVATSLLCACERGYEAIVRLLLNKGADINVQNDEGLTPLMYASGNGHENIVKLLLDKGADITLKNISGLTAYECASHKNCINTMELFEERQNNVDTRNKTSFATSDCIEASLESEVGTIVEDLRHNLYSTIISSIITDSLSTQTDLPPATWPLYKELIRCCENEDVVTFEKLFSAYNCDLILNQVRNNPENSPSTLLHYASHHGLVDCLQILLNHPLIDVNLSNHYGETALIFACSQGHVECVKLLLVHSKIDINHQNRYQYTALISASSKGRLDCVTCLLTHSDIDINIRDMYNNTAVIWTCKFGHIDCLKVLLTHSDMNLSLCNNDGETVLTVAIENNEIEFINVLLNHSNLFLEKPIRDLNSFNSNGYSVLMTACYHGYENAVRFLLENGADIHIRSRDGSTALLCASANGYESIVGMLLDKGADINIQNQGGWTALIYASGNSHEAVVKLLLERGANTRLSNMKGHTAYVSASMNNCIHIMFLLKDSTLNTIDNRTFEKVQILSNKNNDIMFKNDYTASFIINNEATTSKFDIFTKLKESHLELLSTSITPPTDDNT